MFYKIESSVIHSLEYFGEDRVLEIRFHSNKIYPYFEIEEKLVEDFLNSDSKGRFYNENIKGFYDRGEMFYA